MPSDPYNPEPGGPAGRDDAFQRAFAPPAQGAGPYAAGPYAPPAPQDPYAAGPYAPPGAMPSGARPGGWGGYPGPGQPGFPGWQPQGPPTAWSGYAITSFVLGVLGFACFLWAGAIGFGIAALRTVKQRNERGRGLAIAGIVLGGLWVCLGVVGVILIAVFGTDDAESGDKASDGSATAPRTGHISVSDLRTGDCFLDSHPEKESIWTVERVACTKPHNGEVYALAKFSQNSYPTKEQLVADADATCGMKLFEFAPDSWALAADIELSFFHPSELSWDEGESPGITCYLGTADTSTGSLRQDSSALDKRQMDYLRFEFNVDRAFAAQPETEPADDLVGYRAWAGDLADAVDGQIAGLAAGDWGAAAKPADRLRSELRQAVPHLRAAEKAKDAKTFEREIVKAESYLGFERPAAVRSALGLPDDEPTAPDGGEDGTPGTGGQETAAPVADLRAAARAAGPRGYAAV